MPEIYMTVQGRSRDTHRAIAESRVQLGVESSHDYIEAYTLSFLDFPFTDPDTTVKDHVQRARAIEPTVTVAPDIEHGRDPQDVYVVADELLQYSQAVVVVPKSVHPSSVPERFRVGIPTADYGSGAPWAAWDYDNCGPVHILGGGPTRQLRLRPHVDVASLDTATLGKVSRFGYWDGGTVDAPGHWDYRVRLRESLNNYHDVWND